MTSLSVCKSSVLICLTVLMLGGITIASAKVPATQDECDECLPASPASAKPKPVDEPAAASSRAEIKDKFLKLTTAAPVGAGKRFRQDQMSSASAEHRSVEVRTLFLNVPELSPGAEAFYLRPDGTRVKGDIISSKGVAALKVDHTPMDGSQDGIYTVYVVNRSVENGTLNIQTAKMYLINHTCSWGHKFWQEYLHKERQKAKSSQDIPLEIVGENLWNEHVHNNARSGDTIPFTLLNQGRPLEGATLRITSGSGWSRSFKTGKDGVAKVQLIRDYYPVSWSAFKRNQRMTLLATSELDIDQSGSFNGQPYQKIHYSTTFPWRYQLQRDEYSSYTYGMGIVALCTVGTSMGVLFYRERRRRPYREVVFDEKG